jgi:putative redox protein
MEVKTTWIDGMTFSGSAESGYTIPLDANEDVGGAGRGFIPMELVALGLAGCTSMDVISVLQKKRQQVSSFEVLVHAVRAEIHPKVFTHIVLEYVITGNEIDPQAVERAVQLSEEKYCPTQAMLRQVVPIDHIIRIIQAEKGEGSVTPDVSVPPLDHIS